MTTLKTLLAAALTCCTATAWAAEGSSNRKNPTTIPGEVGQQVEKVAEELGAATESQGTFKEAQAFSISGILKGADGGEVTIERKGLPPAVLDMRNETKIFLDGRNVSQSQLPEGAPVKAKFQLEGEETVAVRLDVSSPTKNK